MERMIGRMPEVKMYGLRGRTDIEIWSVKNMRQGTTRFHDSYSICSISNVTQNGAAEWSYRGQSLVSPAKSIMLVEPGEMHVTKRTTGAADFFALHIKPEAVQLSAREEGYSGTPHFNTATFQEYEATRLFLDFHHSVESVASRLEVESRLARCIGFLFQKCMENKFSYQSVLAENSRLLQARDYLEGNASEDVSLDHLANLSGMSRFHFLRCFKKKFGLPPHAYQLQVRITKAMSYLSKGKRDAFLDVGFSDQSHFIRHFKRFIGTTPGKYAQMLQQSIGVCRGLNG